MGPRSTLRQSAVLSKMGSRHPSGAETVGRRCLRSYKLRTLCNPPTLSCEVATAILLPHYIEAVRMDASLLDGLCEEAATREAAAISVGRGEPDAP